LVLFGLPDMLCNSLPNSQRQPSVCKLALL
jgi:hypothetical protein